MAHRTDGAWIDVSVPLRAGMVHWPEDPALQLERTQDMAWGHTCNVTRVTMGVHTGTHMDAPAHFIQGAAAMDALPLDAVIGPATVIPISDPQAVTAAELRGHAIGAGDRILFKTANSDRCWRTDQFTEDFVYIAKEAAAYLAERRVRTVGIDYLSVGGYHHDLVETHRALLGAGIWVIEGLDLSAVEPGRYELVCLPLKLVGVDGAPARAVLRPVDAA